MILLKETKVWRTDTEKEAIEWIQDSKDESMENGYSIVKSGYTMKQKKNKGEVVDEWAEISITFKYEFE